MPVLTLAIVLFPLLQSQAASVPVDRTFPPSNAKMVATVQGAGVQIYRCSLLNGRFGWALQAPDATLTRTSDGVQVGTHAAGPSWKWIDGSAIAGNVVANTASQQTGNVPSLLIETFPVGNTRGFLSNVIWVRRAGANGGVAPPDGCDRDHLDGTARVPYTAAYTFYTASISGQ